METPSTTLQFGLFLIQNLTSKKKRKKSSILINKKKESVKFDKMDTGFKSGLQTNENYWKNKDAISKSATSLQNKQTSKLLSTCTPELDF